MSTPTLPAVGSIHKAERVVVHMVDRKPVESVVHMTVRLTEEPRTINGTTYAKSEIIECDRYDLTGRGHLFVIESAR